MNLLRQGVGKGPFYWALTFADCGQFQMFVDARIEGVKRESNGDFDFLVSTEA